MSSDNFFDFMFQKIRTAKPDQTAYVDQNGLSNTYSDLQNLTEKYGAAIDRLELNNISDVICLVPIGQNLICCLMACFAKSKTVVFVDPKMGLMNFFKVTRKIQSAAVIYLPHNNTIWLLKILFSNLIYLKLDLSVSSSKTQQLLSSNNPWLIDGFTSGTTGDIKRIRRQHKHMIYAAKIFDQHIIPISEDRHLIGYTLSAVRNLMDHGTAYETPKNKNHLFEYIEKNKINRISGPPSISYLAAMAYKNKNQINLNILNIVMGGAPVQKWLLNLLKKTFPNAMIQNIYGCTECEPISHCRAEDILKHAENGYFVGLPVKELRCEYIPVCDNLFELVVYGDHAI
jgi:acyl-coenzyme A synthetase/AMP-(fatty) acid ligase